MPDRADDVLPDKQADYESTANVTELFYETVGSGLHDYLSKYKV
jgi:hypothetical protein